MLEMKVTITAATDLMAVLNNIAAALDGKNPHTVCNQLGADSKHIDNAGTINMGVGANAQPAGLPQRCKNRDAACWHHRAPNPP